MATIDPGNIFAVKGMVALVTGGGTGIGLMITKALVDAGAARVFIVGRRIEVLQQAAASLNKSSAAAAAGGGVVVPLYCDVTSRVSLESLAATVASSDTGYLNLLVCNAGVSGPTTAAPTAQTSLDEWRAQQLAVDPEAWTSTLGINATGPWYTTMAFLNLLDAGNKKGNLVQTSQVIVVSSIAGFNKLAPGGWAYGTSKAAATHVAKMLSRQLPQWNIRANCLAPGLFPSEMSAPIVAAAGGSSDVGTGAELIPLERTVVPLQRMGDNIDMAGQILYLASRAGAYCNGNTIVCDGGRLGILSSYSY